MQEPGSKGSGRESARQLTLNPDQCTLQAWAACMQCLVSLGQCCSKPGSCRPACSVTCAASTETCLWVQVSMPTSPTWMAYAGDGINCIDAVPIAIQRGTFCNAYLGQVHTAPLLPVLRLWKTGCSGICRSAPRSLCSSCRHALRMCRVSGHAASALRPYSCAGK